MIEDIIDAGIFIVMMSAILMGAVLLITGIMTIGIPALTYAFGEVWYANFNAKMALNGEQNPYSYDYFYNNCTTITNKLYDLNEVWIDQTSRIFDKTQWKIINQTGEWTCLKRTTNHP